MTLLVFVCCLFAGTALSSCAAPSQTTFKESGSAMVSRGAGLAVTYADAASSFEADDGDALESDEQGIVATVSSNADGAYEGMSYRDDVVLVRPSEGVGVEEVAAAIGIAPDKVTAVTDDAYSVQLPEDMAVEEAIDTLENADVIDDAQPDYVYHLQEAAGDDARLDELMDVHASTEESSPEEGSEFDGVTDAVVEEQAENQTGEDAGDSTQDGASDEISDVTPGDDDLDTDGADGADDTDASDTVDPGTPVVATELDEGSKADREDEEQALIPDDPSFEKQWSLESIRAPQAWYVLEAAKANPVSVAIIDEGFNVNHEDLRGSFIEASGSIAAFNAVTTVDADRNKVPEVNATGNDSYGHGTHVAGIIAAQANNGIGVAGAACNQKIVPIKVFNDDGVAYTSTLISAYNYILNHRTQYNIRVINMSVGVTGQSLTVDARLKSCIDTAYDAGIVTVGSAGNVADAASGPADNYPSDYEKVVSVINLKKSSTVDDGVTRSSNSNYNRTIDGVVETAKDLSAPGTDIYSTYPSSTKKYANKTGTSMAAPHVASVLALEFAINPQLSAQEAVDILYSTAKDLGVNTGNAGFDAETGYGEVDAYAAVKKAKKTTGSFDASGFTTLQRREWVTEAISTEDEAKEEKTASTPTIATPSYTAGATRMPVGSTSTWKLKHATLKVVSGASVVSIADGGTVVKAKKAGKAKVAVYDEAGNKVKTFNITVYKLSGSYLLKSAKNSKLYLDAQGHSKAKKSQAVVWKKSQANASAVKFSKSGNYYRIKIVKTKKVLKPKGSSKKAGAAIVQAKKTTAKAQQWRISVDSKNRLTFINRASGKVLSIKGSTKANAALTQRVSTGATTEKWVPVAL
ncbi:MAG: S8 family serine peptidase [Coriobacteriaceae bacterium]|nr:S8 family serine peptidase [Coriobacteriaceae bacterium]